MNKPAVKATTSHRWTPERDALLIALLNLGLPVTRIARRLGISEETVRLRGRKLQIGRFAGQPALNSRRWTEEHVNLLRERFRGIDSLPEIARALGRTTHSVRSKAGALGLIDEPPGPPADVTPGYVVESDALHRAVIDAAGPARLALARRIRRDGPQPLCGIDLNLCFAHDWFRTAGGRAYLSAAGEMAVTVAAAREEASR